MRAPVLLFISFFGPCEIQHEASENSPRYGHTEEVVSFLDRSFSDLLFFVHFALFPT